MVFFSAFCCFKYGNIVEYKAVKERNSGMKNLKNQGE